MLRVYGDKGWLILLLEVIGWYSVPGPRYWDYSGIYTHSIPPYQVYSLLGGRSIHDCTWYTLCVSDGGRRNWGLMSEGGGGNWCGWFSPA